MNAVVKGMIGGALLLVLFLGVALLAFALLGPFIFGFEARTVTGGSMTPAMPRGSLALVKQVEPENISVGDIIAFRQLGQGGPIITHRVVEVKRGRNLGFITKGDANEARDAGVVSANEVLGKVVAHVPVMGLAVRFLRTPLGFLFFLMAPAAVLAWYEVKNITLIIRKWRCKGRAAEISAGASISQEDR